ncbi:hypothetical protein K505DRAFT_366716 [Melanomma pulvis-pyrius CBS 109.77]|uniref:Uncharacterized protein n=1 Tax=Melanomma pulvis-pyrius CBS 109.77 TaxID=1314802 RepID=A0A6A6WW70_9PLEO|nr:hypothetical protein K505DRAFT_366716 [Melanomma pulvis-pyrius CBS 109.77]
MAICLALKTSGARRLPGDGHSRNYGGLRGLRGLPVPPLHSRALPSAPGAVVDHLQTSSVVDRAQWAPAKPASLRASASSPSPQPVMAGSGLVPPQRQACKISMLISPARARTVVVAAPWCWFRCFPTVARLMSSLIRRVRTTDAEPLFDTRPRPRRRRRRRRRRLQPHTCIGAEPPPATPTLTLCTPERAQKPRPGAHPQPEADRPREPSGLVDSPIHAQQDQGAAATLEVGSTPISPPGNKQPAMAVSPPHLDYGCNLAVPALPYHLLYVPST